MLGFLVIRDFESPILVMSLADIQILEIALHGIYLYINPLPLKGMFWHVWKVWPPHPHLEPDCSDAIWPNKMKCLEVLREAKKVLKNWVWNPCVCQQKKWWGFEGDSAPLPSHHVSPAMDIECTEIYTMLLSWIITYFLTGRVNGLFFFFWPAKLGWCGKFFCQVILKAKLGVHFKLNFCHMSIYVCFMWQTQCPLVGHLDMHG